MKPSTAITWLWLRLRYGPRGDTPGRLAGLLLWWRTWATVNVLVAPCFTGLLAAEYAGPYLGIHVTWLSAVVLYPHLDAITSPPATSGE